MVVPELVPREVGGGGDCQFLSIRDQLRLHLSEAELQHLGGTELTHLQVRDIAMTGIEKLVESGRLAPDSMGAVIVGTGRTVPEHLTHLRGRGAWGSEETLWGASFELTARLRRPVHINVFGDDWGRRYTPEGAVNAQDPQHGVNVITLNLAFVGDAHYRSLVPRGDSYCISVLY